jgi:hypothetical protein
MYAFVQGQDGHLHVHSWNGVQWQWADQGTPAGTTVASAPGVITYLEAGQQRMYAFVQGQDGHLHMHYWNGVQWQWADQGTPAGTTVASVPGVITYPEAGTQRICAFVRGADDHLHVHYWNGVQWQWADQGLPAGTSVSSAPGVITYLEAGQQRIYAFVQSRNGHLHVHSWNGAQWQWADQGTPAGTTVASAPGVVTYLEAGMQRIYAFVRGADDYVYYWNGVQWQWADQGTPAGTTVASAPGVVTYPEAGMQRIYAFMATVTARNVGTTVSRRIIAQAEVNVTVLGNTEGWSLAKTCAAYPIGLIRERWLALDGAAGPLGCAITDADPPEVPVEGTNARKTTFEHGEIVWSPDHGPAMVVAGYQQDDNLILNWGDTAPFDYDMFIVRWDRDGRNVGQADVSEYIDRTNGFFRIQAPLPARYSLSVEGCDTGIGGADCEEGWTTPVEVEYRLPELPAYDGCPPEAQPFGLIGERWAQMGGAEGPLGCPLARAHPSEGRPGAAQSFRNGEISFSPQQGEQMLLAVHLAGNEIVADWGSTGPFSYDKFILRLDKDGANILQTDVGEGTGGHWSAPASEPGVYTVTVEGCDTGIGGADCPQSWTIPASVAVPVPPPPAVAPPPGSACQIQPVGLIRERWLALRADAGPMGCPVETEHDVPGRRGRAMRFANGEIVWSPDQGDAMVLSVFQEGNGIVVDYGDSGPFTYVWFFVRVDYEGRNVGQIGVPGARGGQYVVGTTRPEDEPEVPTVGSGTGWYSIIVEGCESGIGGSDCEQGWTIPASVFFRTGYGNVTADFSGLAMPRTVEEALRDKGERARRAAQVMADHASLDGNWDDDQTTNAIAMLYLVDHHVAAGQPAKSLRRFGHRFGMLTEIENAVRAQKVYARSGTTIKSGLCKRTGEYDTAMKGYTAILYRYGRLLAPDVRYRMLRLINQTGPHDPDLSSFGCGGVIFPETENHLWMIDSSRFLANQLWAKRSADPRFDNRRNGLADYLIRELQQHLTKDFIEYNSRPYSRYTWMAIQNLYDYSEDPGVKTAAQAVLDYLSAKAAVSMSDGRRNPPYRRRASHNHADFFNPESDRVKKRFLVYTGPTRVMAELLRPNHVEDFAVSEILLAAATTYQPPNLILDLMVNAASRSYYQRFSYASSGEAYAAEPDFLISAGGTPTDYAYVVVGFGKDEDLGVGQPTTLIPTGEITTVSQMIRFAGIPDQIGDPTGLCVAPGFACGLQPTIPPRYTANPACVVVRERWTFIDFATDACKDEAHREFGFYVAVWGAGMDFGLLEAVPKGRLVGISLQRFADDTMARNAGRSFSPRGESRYAAFGGNEIRFNLGSANPIISTGIAAIDAIFHDGAGLAAGTVLDTSGEGAAMTIHNAATGDTLTLDLNDPANPVRTLTEGDPGR